MLRSEVDRMDGERGTVSYETVVTGSIVAAARAAAAACNMCCIYWEKQKKLTSKASIYKLVTEKRQLWLFWEKSCQRWYLGRAPDLMKEQNMPCEDAGGKGAMAWTTQATENGPPVRKGHCVSKNHNDRHQETLVLHVPEPYVPKLNEYGCHCQFGTAAKAQSCSGGGSE